MSERSKCEANGWGVGTYLRGHEKWGNGEGVWTTLRITALGESDMLARCLRHERTAADGSLITAKSCGDRENKWTLSFREWAEISACHCGRPVAFGYDGDLTHHRGMCDECDPVRCDAYPGACREADQ